MANISAKFDDSFLENLFRKAMCFSIQVVRSTELELIVGFIIGIIIGFIFGFVLRPNKIVLSQSRESNSKIDAWFEKQRKPPDKSSRFSSRKHWLRLIVELAFIAVGLEQVRNQNLELSCH